MSENKIRNIGWSVGNYCNSKCSHCYSWHMRKNNSGILSKDEIDLIIDKLIDYGIDTCNFGGNEPVFTAGKDVKQTKLPYIIKRFHEAGVLCGITTNGYTARYLYKNHYDIFMMVNDWDFSLDAPVAELHNKNRQNKDSFDHVLEGMKYCSENGRLSSIVIAGMNWNLTRPMLEKFVHLSQEMNTELRINFLKPLVEKHFDLLPDIEQVYDALNYLFENMALLSLSESVLATFAGVDSVPCPCGINSFRIRSKKNGKVIVSPCVYMDLDGGDILTEDIQSIVDSEIFRKYRDRATNYPAKCKELGCEHIDKCRGGCTSRVLLTKKSFDETDIYCPIDPLNKDRKLSLNKPRYFVEKAENEIRVHENYLCTCIGRPMKPKNC